MKRITITPNHIGLLYKNGRLKQVFTEGSYWVGLWADLEIHNMSLPFLPSQELNVLLQNEALAALVQVIEVGDNELGLLYKDGNFSQVLTAGKFVFWKGATVFKTIKADLNSLYIDETIDKNLLEKGLLNQFVRNFRIEAFEQGILMVNGTLASTLGPGNYYFWKNSDTMAFAKTDMRQLAVDLLGQEVLTRDKAQIRVNITVQYRVSDLLKALASTKDFERQLYLQMQMTLREIVGKLSFDELMEQKDQVAAQAMVGATLKAADLGVELIGFGIKDIILPGDVRDIMNQVLVAEKRAQANVIMRREETASTRSLMNTAKLMEDNAMLLKLKEMEYVEKIAEKIHTITLSGGGQVVDQLKQLFLR